MRRILLVPLLMLLTGAAAPDPVEQLRLAYRLAEWARETGDADAMLAAARIVAATGARSGDIQRGALVEARDMAARPAAALADEADRMAPGDARIAAAAEAVRQSVGRGFIEGPSGAGPLAVRRRLPARAALSWSATARGGEMAIVSAVGDGDSDIDLKVTDRAGRAICVDRARDHYPMCRWAVRSAGSYRIEVTNKGLVPSEVMVLSN